MGRIPRLSSPGVSRRILSPEYPGDARFRKFVVGKDYDLARPCGVRQRPDGPQRGLDPSTGRGRQSIRKRKGLSGKVARGRKRLNATP